MASQSLAMSQTVRVLKAESLRAEKEIHKRKMLHVGVPFVLRTEECKLMT